jgi:hypothetical protein
MKIKDEKEIGNFRENLQAAMYSFEVGKYY